MWSMQQEFRSKNCNIKFAKGKGVNIYSLDDYWGPVSSEHWGHFNLSHDFVPLACRVFKSVCAQKPLLIYKDYFSDNFVERP